MRHHGGPELPPEVNSRTFIKHQSVATACLGPRLNEGRESHQIGTLGGGGYIGGPAH